MVMGGQHGHARDIVGVLEDLAIFVAGGAAGTLNAIVGSGSLITFPTLLAFGIPPVVANVSNNVGLVPGNASAAWGYRRELAGQRSRLLWLAIFSAARRRSRARPRCWPCPPAPSR